ncbi:MAG: DUF2723 domain-containing protein [Gemmatimonadota bacterium]|nr:DUF2723 domain-containing protein [Gemmatimonadota bacterium]MDH5759681.1 DUF2723 domain-containing protein [Gemmatimonadota bacterium]
MARDDKGRPPYGIAALTAVGIFLLYTVTLAPTTGLWDASEYITTAHILGIPHPPGNPLFVVLARVWSVMLAPLGFSVPVRVNLFAAATSAAASGFFFLLAHRMVRTVVGSGARALVGAGAAAWMGATAFTVWNQSNVNEKVYTVSVLIIAAVSWLAVRWRDRHDERGSERYLLAALFLMVIGSTNHLMSVLPLPGLAVLVLLTRPGVLLRRTVLVRGVLLVILGLSFNYVLPVRAAREPVINEGHATCTSFIEATQAIFTNGARGCPALADNLARRQYQKPPSTQRMAPFRAQFRNYFQYFDWQWARGVHASAVPPNSRLPITLLFVLLGVMGLGVVWRADRGVFVYMATLVLVLTVGLVYYLNFKYGYSLAPEVVDRNLHEVRERDYFFIAGFMVWGVLSGIGLSSAWGWMARLSAGAPRYVAAAPVLVVAAFPMIFNWSWASRAGDHAARDWAWNILMSVEPYGVIFTNGDNDTFPLWYLQEVEGIRQDVTVVVGQYLGTSWYPKQLRALTEPERQRPFREVGAVGLYDPPATAPSRAILSVDDERLDRIRPARLPEDLTVPFPRVAVTYPAGMVLDRIQQIALSIILESVDERPIYFSSSGGLMRELGLDRWSVHQGMVSKLVIRNMEGAQPPGWIQGSREFGGAWFDVERSMTLYDDVYLFRGIRDREIWADRATLTIPFLFHAVALQLSDVARGAGLPEEDVRRLEGDAAVFRIVAEGGARGTPPPPVAVGTPP